MNEVLTYIGDDFDQWLAEGNNHDRHPVLQYQSVLWPLPLGHLGGWVLQRPNPKPPYNWVAIPLSVSNELAAVAEVRRHLTGESRGDQM